MSQKDKCLSGNTNGLKYRGEGGGRERQCFFFPCTIYFKRALHMQVMMKKGKCHNAAVDAMLGTQIQIKVLRGQVM